MSSDVEIQQSPTELQEEGYEPAPGTAESSIPSQYPPPPTMKKGGGKVLAVVIVTAIIVVAVIVTAFMMGPGVVGKWDVVSVKSTILDGPNETVVWDYPTDEWIEFKEDGTGVTSDGDMFIWETGDDMITITDAANNAFGTMDVPLHYTLEGDDMTIRGLFSPGLYVVITMERA